MGPASDHNHPGSALTSATGGTSHPEQDRLLTVREMALLQGFPADYVFEGPLTARYNQIGDAVPPMISAQVAAHIASLAGIKLSKRPMKRRAVVG